MKIGGMVSLRAVQASDADLLFPMIFESKICETILWDGPSSLEEYQSSIAERAVQHAKGEVHFFTIIESANQTPAGTITIRPVNDFKANIGLWVGEKFHGRGLGTEAVRLIMEYGFGTLKLSKIEATVFVGNDASRKIFEKNGFQLEGTLRMAERKRGKLIDEWLLGITVND